MERQPAAETSIQDEETELVLSCIEASAAAREDFDLIDQEVLENYLMIPYGSGYDAAGRTSSSPSVGSQTVLKDDETHVSIETLLAKTILTMFGPRGFCSALPVGREDAKAAAVASAIEESSFRAGGNYRSMYVGLKDCFLFGSTVFAPAWAYFERQMPVRRFQRDILTQQTVTSTHWEPRAYRDELELIPIDRDDFFDDPNADTIQNMSWAARRFKVSPHRARQLAEEGRWKKVAVENAIRAGASLTDKIRNSSWRDGIDRNLSTDGPEDYQPIYGYEWYGEVPWKPKDGARWRRITLLAGEKVESRPMPLATTRPIPFYEFVVNPINGRFRGFSPGYLARYTQSFYDALLISIAEAVIRQTGPPFLVNRNSGIKLDALMKWRPNVPVVADRIDNAITEIPYNPPLQAAFTMLQQMKSSMERTTGAQGGVTGAGLGTKRMTAGEAAMLGQAQVTRPEAIAAMFEREYLPALGQGVFELNQQFIASDADLQRRVGAQFSKMNVSLTDIDGEFDLQFVGSEKQIQGQAMMAAIERIWSIIGSIPGAAPSFPWNETLLEWLQAAGLREIEAAIDNPQQMEKFVANALAQGGGPTQVGNGNSQIAVPGQEAQMPPTQTAGQPVGLDMAEPMMEAASA